MTWSSLHKRKAELKFNKEFYSLATVEVKNKLGQYQICLIYHLTGDEQ